MNKIRRVLAVAALLAVLFIAGFTIAQWQGSSDTHSNERPPAGATGDSSPSDSTPTTAPGDKSSDSTRSGGDESTHIDKPGESK